MRFARHAEVYPDNSQRRRVIRSKDRAAMFTRSIHPQNSGLSVSPRPLSLSLFFSVQYPEPLSIPFNPLRQSVPGEKLSYFPAAKHTFPFVFTRFNTRCISAVILITRHGFKFKIELVAFIFVRESISCFFLFFIREKN